MDRQQTQEHLAEAERHVAEGERLLERQRELLAQLRANLATAVAAVAECENSQRLHVADRDRLRKALDEFPAV